MLRAGRVAAAAAGAIACVSALHVGPAAGGSLTCGSGEHGNRGYAYAGHLAAAGGHGVRARITLVEQASVRAGHVAGWVGVGGPRSGPNGEDQWLQVGIAVLPQTAPMLYVEITQASRRSRFVQLETDLEPGATRSVAVLEVASRPGWWRVWVGATPVTRPIRLLGASDQLPQIATAESWNGGQADCNAFRFRFERVGVAGTRGGSWQTFRSVSQFLDRGYRIRKLASAQDGPRLLSGSAVEPYAFEASSP